MLETPYTKAVSDEPLPHVPTTATHIENCRREIRQGADRFLAWLDRHGCASFDPYDVWGTRYGLWSRKIYYRHGAAGLPLIAPIVLLELLAPGARQLFVAKKRYATADGQLVIALLNLHRRTGKQALLEQAKHIAAEMLEYSVSGYSGYCWGYPFDWQHSRDHWQKNTPYITCTPYGFEAFLALFDATGDTRHLATAESIANFVFSDLNDTSTGADSAASSYSPLDNSKIVNASAYRAWVLIEAAARFSRLDFKEKGLRNLRFILENQREDGAWLYGIDDPKNAFIDHFHTCFVLRNLKKINSRLASEEIKASIGKGYIYYRDALFGPDGLPRSFAIQPRTQIVRLEMMNMAEAITLGSLLADEMPEAFTMAQTLALRLTREFQLADGHFATRINRGGWRHTFPFMRWPQAQLFLALTNLLVRLDQPYHEAPEKLEPIKKRRPIIHSHHNSQ